MNSLSSWVVGQLRFCGLRLRSTAQHGPVFYLVAFLPPGLPAHLQSLCPAFDVSRLLDEPSGKLRTRSPALLRAPIRRGTSTRAALALKTRCPSLVACSLRNPLGFPLASRVPAPLSRLRSSSAPNAAVEGTAEKLRFSVPSAFGSGSPSPQR
jgi:hypothetical protein